MTSSGYRRFAEEHCRLVILRVTAEGRGVANDRLLRNGLEHWGLVCTLEQVHQALDWLAERGLVSVQDLSGATPPVRRVAITNEGREVAEGRVEVGGVAPRSRVVD